MKIATSPFVYWGVAVFMPEKNGESPILGISRSKSMALVGNLKGAISRRINIQHRLVYQVLQEEHVVKVLRMWTHYE